MEAAATIATAVEPSTSTAASTVTAMLSKSRHGRANENEGSDTSKKSL
jgi:hypothetical protein